MAEAIERNINRVGEARLEDDPEETRKRREAAFAALEEWRERVLASRAPGEQRPTAVESIRADRDKRDWRDRRRAGIE